jgi:hypothetical protein
MSEAIVAGNTEEQNKLSQLVDDLLAMERDLLSWAACGDYPGPDLEGFSYEAVEKEIAKRIARHKRSAMALNNILGCVKRMRQIQQHMDLIDL